LGGTWHWSGRELRRLVFDLRRTDRWSKQYVGKMMKRRRNHEQKIVRYLGITGHYRPDALIEAIHRHPIDPS
jgi:hypothetical protein